MRTQLLPSLLCSRLPMDGHPLMMIARLLRVVCVVALVSRLTLMRPLSHFVSARFARCANKFVFRVILCFYDLPTMFLGLN